MQNTGIAGPTHLGLAWVLGAALLGLAGCANGRGEHVELSSAPAPSMSRFENRHYGIVFDYPKRINAARTFESDYFLGKRWNPDVARDIPGTALLSLTLPESNHIIRATLRVGASDDARAADVCQTTPGSEQARWVRLRGVDFTRQDHDEAGTSHYSQVRSYRGVHDHQCIAIDLIVTGVNPGVYAADEPPTPPFSVSDGMKRLDALLDGLAFIDRR